MKLSHIPLKRIDLIFLGFICLVSIFVYSVSIPGQFIYDDEGQIVRNTAIQSLFSWDDFRKVLFESNRPTRWVLNVFYSILWNLSPGSPVAFKTFSLLLHLANCVLSFFLIARLSPRDWRSRPFLYLCIWAFALHPLQVQSVSYVMGVVSLLQHAVFMLCLLAVGTRSIWFTLGLFVLGFLSPGIQ